jgi:hypothetical protein
VEVEVEVEVVVEYLNKLVVYKKVFSQDFLEHGIRVISETGKLWLGNDKFLTAAQTIV